MRDPVIIDCEQGSPEWYAARMGVPTASEFSTVMAKGRDGGDSKTRKTYLFKLAGERMTGEPMESYSNGYMVRGKALEEEARTAYAFMQDVDPLAVGFIKNHNAGCSPDALIGTDGGLEIKCAIPSVQIERLERDDLPPEYKAQVQGGLWITNRLWWDFVSYCPKLPLLVVRVHRDEGYIANLAGAVKQFNIELSELCERIRRREMTSTDRLERVGECLRAG